jgi:hypothetical protein
MAALMQVEQVHNGEGEGVVQNPGYIGPLWQIMESKMWPFGLRL